VDQRGNQMDSNVSWKNKQQMLSNFIKSPFFQDAYLYSEKLSKMLKTIYINHKKYNPPMAFLIGNKAVVGEWASL